MTRVHHARPQQAAHRSITLDQPRAVVKKKKPYKIVLEAVTQEKKKLHSILTYASNAPKGFGFVPAGNPEFTEWCKEQCRQRNLDVHIVSAKPKNKMHTDPEKLSHHVHRVGHHFPLEIVNLACSKFGYVYDEEHGLRKDKSRERTNWIAQGVEDYSSRQVLHGRPTTEKESKEHTRGAVREMFPKIPEADLNSIINHAFEEGTTRVGNAKELTLARRVQLAVVAHIRHVYTEYDNLLKTGTWTQARQTVEHVSLAKLKEWRDEAGGQSNEIEDTFREVIVLDDDDESSEDGSLSTPDEREQSMEIVSSRATARDLQPERYADYPRMDVHAMRRMPKRTILVQPYPPPHSAHLPASLHRQPVSHAASEHPRQYPSSSESRPPVRNESFSMAHNRPISQPSRMSTIHTAHVAPQPLLQEIGGQMYHVSVVMVEPRKRDIKLEPIRDSRGPSRPQHQHDHITRATPLYAVPPPPETSSFNRPPGQSRRASEQDVILPSVERETVDVASPRRITHGHPSNVDLYPVSTGYATEQSQKRKSFPTFQDDRDVRAGEYPKRLRPLYYEDDSVPRTVPSHSTRPAHTSNYQHMDVHSRYRAPPAQEYIDLTSSPRRLPTNGDGGYHAPARTRADPGSSGFSSVTMTSRQSPPREVRAAKYEVHPGEPPRRYMSNSDIHDGRAQPVRDYIPMRAHQHRLPVDGHGLRYSRDGLH